MTRARPIGRRCLLVGIGAWHAAAVARAARGQTPGRSAGPPRGSLLIIGGGQRGIDIQDAAIQLSGGNTARWIFIPTAGTDAEVAAAKPPDFIARAGAPVTTLHTRDRSVADSEAFTAPLRAANAVFLGGGRQWRLVDAYADTRIERELRAVLDRDGLIAGTSAGASIQASYLVRGSPRSNKIMMAPGYERGFGYLSNIAVDQHVSQRDRENDLSEVVAAHPGLLGIGIDESTAVIVQHDTARVIGRGIVRITDGADHGGRPYYDLKSGTRFDLATWRTLS